MAFNHTPDERSFRSFSETPRVLVTGTNSGLGFEPFRQLAAASYGSVITDRSETKAVAFRQDLVVTTGCNPFEMLVVDVVEIGSSHDAPVELVGRGVWFAAVQLNAGLVTGALG